MKKEILQASIKKKSKQIELLKVFSRAIKKTQENKSKSAEEMQLAELEKHINKS